MGERNARVSLVEGEGRAPVDLLGGHDMQHRLGNAQTVHGHRKLP